MHFFEIEQINGERIKSGRAYLEFFRNPQLSVGIYVLRPGELDQQQPHGEDEVYYVLSGRASVTVGNEDRFVQAGTLVVVPPKVEHRFHTIIEDLKLLVLFAPAEGTAS